MADSPGRWWTGRRTVHVGIASPVQARSDGKRRQSQPRPYSPTRPERLRRNKQMQPVQWRRAGPAQQSRKWVCSIRVDIDDDAYAAYVLGVPPKPQSPCAGEPASQRTGRGVDELACCAANAVLPPRSLRRRGNPRERYPTASSVGARCYPKLGRGRRRQLTMSAPWPSSERSMASVGGLGARLRCSYVIKPGSRRAREGWTPCTKEVSITPSAHVFSCRPKQRRRNAGWLPIASTSSWARSKSVSLPSSSSRVWPREPPGMVLTR